MLNSNILDYTRAETRVGCHETSHVHGSPPISQREKPVSGASGARSRTVTAFVTAAVVWLCAAGSMAMPRPPQQEERGPDGTPLACNFHFRLYGYEPVSTDCGNYHIALDRHSNDPAHITFTISEQGSGQEHTYRLTDMPLDEPLLLMATPQQPTRVLSRRRLDRIDFTVGRVPFAAPPPRALRPRTSTSAPPAESVRSYAPAVTTKGALVGTWRTQGVILELRQNGTFSRVSNTSYGTYGSLPGLVDDDGTYEINGDQVILKGIRTRTCSYTSAAGLVCNGVGYRRQ